MKLYYYYVIIMLIQDSLALVLTPKIKHLQRYHKWNQATSAEVEGIIETVQEWVKHESFGSLVTKPKVMRIIGEVKQNQEAWKVLEKLWIDTEQEILNDTRSLKEVLGENSYQQILTSVEKVDIYEPESVKAFLSSPAIEV